MGFNGAYDVYISIREDIGNLTTEQIVSIKRVEDAAKLVND